MDVLKGLNKEQKEAVTYFSSPLLVLAGAGSGKTRVITHKIMFLVNNIGIPLNRILAITFTNKAAKEMKERVKSALSLEGEPQWITTFHSLSAKILRIEAQALGYHKDFVIYDEEDSKKAVKDILKELDLSDDIYKPEKVKSTISQIKQYLDSSIIDFYSMTMPHLPKILEKYEEHLALSNAMDFDDLLLNVVKLFKENPEILKKWQNKFDYILVDEYQDTNKIQHEILKLLVGERDCITVVGDPQQCIYTWRGANPENILDFEKDFPGTKIIKLERNYRSTGIILDTANKVIKNAKGRWKEKVLKLWTEKEEGEKPVLVSLDTEKQEANFIAKKIKELVSQEGFRYSDFAVLIRMSYLSRNIEEYLMKYNIPYQVIGGVKFFERAEVKDILAYLRFAFQPKDTQAFKRIINLPSRGIGEKTIKKIESFKEENWLQALKDAFDTLSPKIKMRVQEFLEVIETVRKYGNEKPSEMAKYVIDSINYEEYLKSKYPKDWEDRLENVKELITALKEVEKSGKTFLEFLEESSLSQAQDSMSDENTVKVMTVHAAKGLEFPVVFVAGVEEGIFPSARSFEDPEQMEEERRLFYVAITRAKEKLFFTKANYRSSYNGRYNETKKSRFIEDIKENLKALKTRKSVEKNKKSRQTGNINQPLPNSFRVGELVKHDVFGKGVIKSITGNNATVVFGELGEKKIRTDFLKKVN